VNKRTTQKIQAFKIRERQPYVNGRAPTFRAATAIPPAELLTWLKEDGDPLMVRVTWNQQPYLMWKDDWDAAETV
jgi:hypothetical protein